MTEILGEDPVVASRQDGDGTRTQPSQLGQTGGAFKNVDRLELDPTDREKLFQSQAAGSARLPECL